MFVNCNNMNNTKNKVFLETVSERFSVEMNKRKENVVQIETKPTAKVGNEYHSIQIQNENKKVIIKNIYILN